MDIFKLDDRVEAIKGHIPSDSCLPIDQTYRIIGMRKRVILNSHLTEFLLQVPTGTHGYNIIEHFNPNNLETYYISKRDYFDGCFVYWVKEVGVRRHDKVTKADGAQCLKCKDFVYMAEPDGFICRACILDPYRCSSLAWNGDD